MQQWKTNISLKCSKHLSPGKRTEWQKTNKYISERKKKPSNTRHVYFSIQQVQEGLECSPERRVKEQVPDLIPVPVLPIF